MNLKNKKLICIIGILVVFVVIALIIFVTSSTRKDNNADETTKSQVTATPSPTPEVTADPYAGMVRSEMTGEYVTKAVSNKRPYAVMINNIEYAFMHQKGTSKADIIYEALAEGGITRMLAIYEDVSDVKKIGSVRSARHYYVEFADEWDAIYCHFGHTKYALAKIEELKTDNLSGLSGIGSVVYARDSSISAPHNVYTTGEKLKKGAKKLKYSTKRDADKTATHFEFYTEDTDLTGGKKAKKITIPFSAYSTCVMKYSTKSKTYKKYEYGKKQMDRQYKKQLSFKNVIIQLVEESNIDSNGYQTMKLKNAQGKGYYYTNGKRKSITWKKKESSDKMTYYDAKGNVLTINPGKTYIAVYPKNRSSLIK